MEHAGTRGRGRGQGPRHRPRALGDRARSSSCAARATTAATASSPPAGWRSPAPRSSSPSSPPRRGRGRVAPPRTGTASPATPASPRSTLPVARDVAMFGQGIEKAAVIVDALLGTGVRGALREPIRSAVELIGRARAAGVPVVAVDTPTAVDLSSGEPSDPAVVGRPDRHVPSAQDRPADAPRRGARRQGPRRPDRHPAGGRPWLSRAGSAASRAGARSCRGRGRGRASSSGAAVVTSFLPTDAPGGRLPHAARDRRADRRDRLAAVAHLAPAGRPARGMIEPPAATPAPVAPTARPPGRRPRHASPPRPGTSSSSAAGSSAPARCSTPSRAGCARRSSSRTTSRPARRRARRGSSTAACATSSSSGSGSSARRSPNGARLLDARAAPRPHRAAAVPDLRHPVRVEGVLRRRA